MKAEYQFSFSPYGFGWGDCWVERTASSATKTKFQILTIKAPNGDRIEIQMSPRKTYVEHTPKTRADK